MSTNCDPAQTPDADPDLDPDVEIAQLIDRLMRRIHAGLNARAHAFDVHRVGPGGGVLLLTLAEIEPTRMQEVVRRMARDKSQMSRGVQALERKGLVERRAAPDDARGALLALTPEGRETVGVLQRAVAGVLDELLTPLSPAERDDLKTLLKKL